MLCLQGAVCHQCGRIVGNEVWEKALKENKDFFHSREDFLCTRYSCMYSLANYTSIDICAYTLDVLVKYISKGHLQDWNVAS